MTMRARHQNLAAKALASIVLIGSAIAPSAAVAEPVPGSRCRVFPGSNIWNTRVDALPVHELSDTWLRSAGAGSTNLHPDFGPPSYGLPFDVVGRRHAKVHVRFTYAAESDPGPYPFDARTPIEGGSDRHVLIVERGTCRLYELFAASWTSADAAGLPILPGLVRWDEVKAGSILHAIRFTVSCTTDAYVWPARHEAGVDDPECPPMGARFRLKADFDLAGFSPRARTILRAMQRYGLMLADNGSNWYFQGTRDGHWRNHLLDQLKTVPASAFEAVDVSGCMVDADSGKADCPV
jgi:hypothetical protein